MNHTSSSSGGDSSQEGQTARGNTMRSDAFLSRAMQLFGDAVYRVAVAQTGSPADAEDIYQDVFLRLLKDATVFCDDDHLKAWLLRVTVNRCHDLARMAWKRHAAPLQSEHADIAAPHAFCSEVWDVIGALPPDLRATVHLFYIEGYHGDEIARIMHCHATTVRTRLHRARQLMKHALTCEDEIPDARRDDFVAPTPPSRPASAAPNPRKESTHDSESLPSEFRRLPHDDGEDCRPCTSTI